MVLREIGDFDLQLGDRLGRGRRASGTQLRLRSSSARLDRRIERGEQSTLDSGLRPRHLVPKVSLGTVIVIPSRMGRLNQRALLAQLQRMKMASRADLAKALGLSQPTAGKIADELLELGILEEVDESAATASGRTGMADAVVRPGRPGRLLQLSRGKPRFLGIQLGVTDTMLSMLTVCAGAEDRWDSEFGTPSTAAEWRTQLRRACKQMPTDGLWGVLVSVPGVVDELSGRVVFSANLHWTESVDLRALVQQVWDLPVALVQEERALALGHQAVDREGGDFLLVDFGDGVGGAAVVSGRLYATPLPISGELGHTPVLGNHRPCGCGAVGCVETLVSTRGLLQSFEGVRRQPGEWNELIAWVSRYGVTSWLAEALDAVAIVIAGALNVLGVRRVVVTGSLLELGPAVNEHLAGAICKGTMWARFGSVDCVVAPRRRTAGLVAVGMDRLVLPVGDTERPPPRLAAHLPPGRKAAEQARIRAKRSSLTL